MSPARLVISRIAVALLAAFSGCLLLALAIAPGYAKADPSHAAAPNPIDKLAPWVIAHTADGAQAEFLVILADQADVSGAARFADKSDKGRYVYQTLYAKARGTQKPIEQWLTDRGVEHRAFYIVNAFWVKADRSIALQLAARLDVARIEGNPVVQAKLPRPDILTLNAPDTAEPGLTYVHAPEVWAQGYTGQGIVIGGQDTGYMWDHPALKNKYRGWNGTSADHNYNWHDSIHTGTGTCGADSPAPCDVYGHGTHTMGIMVGDDGAGNQVGMAPGAQWIGCRDMDNAGNGTPVTYLECFEFFLAPYPLGGTPAQGDPAKAPDVTSNSWGCPPSEGCSANTLLQAVQMQRAAGIMTVASAGNYGSSCATVRDPIAIYDETYTVGSFSSSTGLIASSSSRGPVTIDGSNRPKPDIAAPGVSVRSSTNNGLYGTMSGTSMAAPHVAGAVALLWSARPHLTNQITATEDLLNQSADHVVVTNTCSSDGWPNNVYGYGRLNVLAAVNAEPPHSGTLMGSVTDALTAQPIQWALITATLSTTVNSQTFTTTSAGGTYALLLPAGFYTLTTTAYGYDARSDTGLFVAPDLTTTFPLTLTPQASYVVSGVVSDAVTGRALAATITISGYPGSPIETNPATGFYSITLAGGITHTFNVVSQIPGYLNESRIVEPLIDNRVEDFPLQPDLKACIAPGYMRYGLIESFDAATTPPDWTVINPGWSFDHPIGPANLTGGTGNFALADSTSATIDTSLRTPSMNFSDVPAVTLTFKSDLLNDTGLAAVADVDVSLAGTNGPWTHVWRKTINARGPVTETIDLTALIAYQPDVTVRFHYDSGDLAQWWQLDDVEIGQCSLPLPGMPQLTPTQFARSALPGATVTYTLQLSNTDTASHTFDVLLAGNTWPMSPPQAIGPLDAHASASFDITVTVPADILVEQSDVAQLTVRAQDNADLQDHSILTTTANTLPIITPAAMTLEGEAGAQLTYTLQVTNTNTAARTYDVLLTGDAPAMATTPVGPVPPHGTAFFTVTLDNPPDALGLTSSVISATLQAQGNPVLSATAVLTAVVTPRWEVQLSPAAQSKSGAIGTTVIYHLNVVNLGNMPDVYHLGLQNNQWPASLSLTQTLVTVTPGFAGQVELTAYVTIPVTATFGLSDAVHIVAQGTGVSAFSDLVTTAKFPYDVFLPLLRRD